MASKGFVKNNYKSLFLTIFIIFLLIAAFAMSKTVAERSQNNSSRTTVDVNSQSARMGASSEPSVDSGGSLPQANTKAVSNNVNLNINGEDIPVPENGSVHKEFSSDNGSNNIELRVNSTSNGESQSSVRIRSDSSSSSTYKTNSNVNIENGEVSQ
jgi:hypothetical protein